MAARAARDGYGRLLALPAAARNRLKDHWKSVATSTGVSFDPARHDGLHLDDLDPDAVGNRRSELMLVCAHTAIDPAVRTPLILNTVRGFTAVQIATALAVPSATLAARLVRAKRRTKDARMPFVIPDRGALPGRLAHVLEAVYGAYAIDWPIGGTEQRPTMAGGALHLAETLASLLPRDGEVHGLAALICLSEARAPARLDADGDLVPLGEQDPQLRDASLVARGHEHLRVTHATRTLGRFGLEAAIQAVHCARRDSAPRTGPCCVTCTAGAPARPAGPHHRCGRGLCQGGVVDHGPGRAAAPAGPPGSLGP